ncbi:MAG TPA: amino acid ABC transporter substrate-binding protein [Anaeromyxobacteraceae bacterium]|nr:amino acid ABC transporter substrate-binding protein [Anaeromyxobacteraceae bacterium]
MTALHRSPRPLLVPLLAALALAARPSPAPAAERTRILIGATLPLTGAEARIGGYFKEGYELAFEEANKKGGLAVDGRKLPVELKLLDDTTTQATAVSLADRLVNSDQVDFLLGSYATHLIEAQTTVAEQNRVPYVNGGGAASKIYKRGFKYVFGALAPVELLGTTLMQWIDVQQKAGKLPKPAKIALLWENTSHGKDFQKGISDFVARSGGAYQIAVDESFALDGKDFSALLGKVKAANVDLFLADAHLPDYITMHRQYVSAGLCHKVVSYGARGSEKGAIDALGQENVSYVLSGVWWSPLLGSRNALAKGFVEAFKARYGGRSPEWFQALGYEAARALFTAIQQAGAVDREKVRQKLAELKMASLLPGGTLEFPAATGQQAQNPFVLQQNLPGAGAPIVYPPELATGTAVPANPRCAR